VHAAHVRQCERQGKPNAALTAAELAAPGRIEPDATTLLEHAAEKLGFPHAPITGSCVSR
jgi:hypothetical protein